jgi:hypothetical protein
MFANIYVEVRNPIIKGAFKGEGWDPINSATLLSLSIKCHVYE